MMQTSHLVSSFESVRETIANFCREREWGAYHLPASLTLALTGNSFLFQEQVLTVVSEPILPMRLYMCDIVQVNAARFVRYFNGKANLRKEPESIS